MKRGARKDVLGVVWNTDQRNGGGLTNLRLFMRKGLEHGFKA